MIVLSVFPGIGLLDRGFEAEGFQLPPFKKTEAGRAIGNGVPVHVAQAWAKAIKLAVYGKGQE